MLQLEATVFTQFAISTNDNVTWTNVIVGIQLARQIKVINMPPVKSKHYYCLSTELSACYVSV